MIKDVVLVATLLFVWALTSPQTRTAVQYAQQAPAGTLNRLSAALRGWHEPGEAHKARLERIEQAHPGMLATLID
jgi:hypothetical protein